MPAVQDWLDQSEVDDGESSVIDVPSSVFGDLDARNVVDEKELLGGIAEETEEALQVENALGDVARSTQRMKANYMASLYVRGRPHDHPDYSLPQVRQQRIFRIESYMVMSSLDDPVLYDALRRGPVITRLSAETGMGKTMKLPGAIATKCGLRVLVLELDNNIASTAMKFQAKMYNLRTSGRRWSREKGAYLTVVSYHEFRGIMNSGDRDRFFSDFDVFYFDESHAPLAVVYAANQCYANYAPAECSLILASATASSEQSNNSVAKKVGTYVQSPKRVTLQDALDSGVLMREHMRDRVMLIVASDEQAALARSVYEENGADARLLDTGSSEADHDAVLSWMARSNSVVPRILVVVEKYGTSYNFPTSYVCTTGTIRVYSFSSTGDLVEEEIPLMEKSVVQHKGRSGRGLAVGSGGWVMSPDRSPDRDLMASEAMEAYISLVAADIRPKTDLFASVIPLLPRGLNRDVARLLLRCTLPVGLTVRYLGTDGRFAAKYLPGLEVFYHRSEKLRPSKDEFPVGYERWISEEVGNYYEGDESATQVKLEVPFASPPGLKIVMHTISAVSEGMLDVPRWSAPVTEELSDDEYSGVRTKVKRKVPPRHVSIVTAPPVPEPSVASSSWAYDVDPGKAARDKRRQAMSWQAQGEGRAAVTVLLKELKEGKLGDSRAEFAEDLSQLNSEVSYALPVQSGSPVGVESPGGGQILSVARAVHDKLMGGVALTPVQFVAILKALKVMRAEQRFAKSTVFNNWSPAWLSWFSSYSDANCVNAMKGSGVHKTGAELLSCLYDRFSAEVAAVACSSNLYKDKLSGFFRKTPSVRRFVMAVQKGALPIAQSDAFVKRVFSIREAYAQAVMDCEREGLYMPHEVTKAQKALPLRDKFSQVPIIDDPVQSNIKGISVERLVPSEDRWRD